MSKWIEYLKLVPSGIQNLDKFIEAKFTEIKLSKGNLPEDEIKEILRRRLICENCEFNSENAQKQHGYKTSRKDLHCSFCGCDIETRTACLNCSCGIESWNIKNTARPKELKWKKYVSSQS